MFAYLPSFQSTSVFFLAALVLAIMPGPGMMYVMARTVSGGRGDGVASALGTSLGGLLHVGLATAGLSALLAASARAFTIIKYVGAAYLLVLGVRSLLHARSAHNPSAPSAHGARRAFLEGILTEALNVKTALFFLAFIPQFIDHAVPSAPQFAFLGIICVVLNTSVDFVVIALAFRLANHLRTSPKPARRLNYVSGFVLIGLGAFVAFD